MNFEHKTHAEHVEYLRSHADDVLRKDPDSFMGKDLQDAAETIERLAVELGTFKTTQFDMCDMCAEIVETGYHADTVDNDHVSHQKLVNHIDKDVLPGGASWSGNVIERSDTDYSKTCAGCSVRGTNHICIAVKD